MKRIISPISRVPLLRLLLPLVVGVILFVSFSQLWLLLVGVLLLLSIGVFYYRNRNSEQASFLGWSGITIGALLVGMLLAWMRMEDEPSFDFVPTYYRATVIDAPDAKERSFALLCRVEAVGDSGQRFVRSGYKALLYLPKSREVGELQVGDKLLFLAPFVPPQRGGLPGGFDYGAYLQRQGIYQTAYVDSSKWARVGVSRSLRLWPTRWKIELLHQVRSLLPAREHHAVVEALLLGQKRELSEEQRRNFRVGGLSHLLAVSGFHVGILFTLFSFCFFFIGRDSRFYLLRVVVPLLLLWGYAFVVGASASVLRASLMLSLYALSKLVRREPNSYNTVAFAALMLVVIDPYALWDVGAQLSFVAVLGILYVNELSREPMRKLLRWQRTLLSIPLITLAAQLATLPLTLYHFYQFPLLFLVANVMALPLVYLILFLTLPVMLIYGSLGFEFTLLLKLLEWCIDALNGVTGWIASRSFAVVEELYIPGYWIVMLYSGYLIWLFPIRLTRKVVGSMVVVVVWLGVTTIRDLQIVNERSTTLYYTRSGRSLVEINGSQVVITSDSLHSREADSFRRWAGRRGGGSEVTFCSDSAPLWQSRSSRLLFLDRDTLRYRSATSSFPVDYLILERGCRGDLSHYCQLFAPREVLIAPSVTPYWREKWQLEADSLAIVLQVLRRDGAVVLD